MIGYSATVLEVLGYRKLLSVYRALGGSYWYRLLCSGENVWVKNVIVLVSGVLLS